MKLFAIRRDRNTGHIREFRYLGKIAVAGDPEYEEFVYNRLIDSIIDGCTNDQWDEIWGILEDGKLYKHDLEPDHKRNYRRISHDESMCEAAACLGEIAGYLAT